jgi:hypothetical protein
MMIYLVLKEFPFLSLKWMETLALLELLKEKRILVLLDLL